jgi:hypothetical protein
MTKTKRHTLLARLTFTLDDKNMFDLSGQKSQMAFRADLRDVAAVIERHKPKQSGKFQKRRILEPGSCSTHRHLWLLTDRSSAAP